MKHLAVALIVLGLLGCDIASDLWVESEKTRHGWDAAASVGLAAAALWFAIHIGDKS